jgi:hypothetical protein
VAREVERALDDRVQLAALVGGEAALSSMPFAGHVPPTQCLSIAKKLTGVATNGDIDLTELFSFVSHDATGDTRYNWLGTPNASTSSHAIITRTALRYCIAYDVKGCDDDVALFWHVFAGERDRLLTPNAHGARLSAAFSATTDGNSIHFQYTNLNVLNRCDTDVKARARGLTRTVPFHFASYKALLPRDVQQSLCRAEEVIKRLKKVRVVIDIVIDIVIDVVIDVDV